MYACMVVHILEAISYIHMHQYHRFNYDVGKLLVIIACMNTHDDTPCTSFIYFLYHVHDDDDLSVDHKSSLRI